MMAMTARKLKRLLSVYPPYLGAGVRVTHIADDFLTAQIEMPLRFYNRNYVGTHFGGSLYAMCDPFFMLMLINILGPDYIVWDKSAAIRFKRPGKGTVKAVFQIPAERVTQIRAAADANGKVEPEFQVVVTDADGQVVAEIDKLLYVRRKEQKPL
jgi:acyl-coenzyme A thioesterase PaaI-like protein